MPCSKQKQVSKHLREASKKIEGKEQQLIMAALAMPCRGLVTKQTYSYIDMNTAFPIDRSAPATRASGSGWTCMSKASLTPLRLGCGSRR